MSEPNIDRTKLLGEFPGVRTMGDLKQLIRYVEGE